MVVMSQGGCSAIGQQRMVVPRADTVMVVAAMMAGEVVVSDAGGASDK